MRKWILCLLLVFLFVSTTGLAESQIDIGSMTFDELVELKQQIELAIFESDGWQEVTVPAGIYEVGVDIPAGRWTIAPVDGQTASVAMGTSLAQGGAELDEYLAIEQITSPNDSYAKYNTIEKVSWTLEEGTYFYISDANVIFTPYTGANLGFK